MIKQTTPSKRGSLGPLRIFATSFRALLVLVFLGGWQPLWSLQGSIEAWGWDEYGQVSETPAGTDFVQVTAGPFHGVAVRADGSLAAWGRDNSGVVSLTPTGTGFVQVVAGSGFSMGLKVDGSIVVWGTDWFGQVSNAPQGAGFAQIAAGLNHCLAVHSDGTVVAWGYDGHGQVSGAPSGDRFVQVAAGASHSMALRSDGSMIVWGTGTNGLVSDTPAGTGFVQIAGKAAYAQALHADGHIITWGTAWAGVVANTPTEAEFSQIALGGVHSLALRSDGTLHSWGGDWAGQVSNTPAGSGFIQVASGGDNHSYALRANNIGSAFCFGDGTGIPCPCAAYGNPGEGCANTAGLGGATLTGSGLAAIGGDTFQLQVSGAPGDKPGLILRGANALAGGLGIVVGDGLLCTSGQTARSQIQRTSPAGDTLFTDFQGNPFGASSYGAGSPTNYQFWYRDPTNTCTGSGFNFTNAWSVSWMP